MGRWVDQREAQLEAVFYDEETDFLQHRGAIPDSARTDVRRDGSHLYLRTDGLRPGPYRKSAGLPIRRSAYVGRLKFLGYEVVQVMNLTDVDDRTIQRVQETGKSLDEVTRPVIEAFFADLDRSASSAPSTTRRPPSTSRR